jgi:hypothetical protein
LEIGKLAERAPAEKTTTSVPWDRSMCGEGTLGVQLKRFYPARRTSFQRQMISGKAIPNASQATKPELRKRLAG